MSGAVFAYALVGSSWFFKNKFLASDINIYEAGAFLGCSLSMMEDQILVGASGYGEFLIF
jgi:hypothetical protein